MDFNSRLDSLKKRRQGPSDRVFAGAMDSASEYAVNSELLRKSESFEGLQESDSVKYAVGAMAAVDSNYTRISIGEGERVASSLSQSLSRENIGVDTRLQGSVGLDVHIKGYSDVDMLVLVGNTILVEEPCVQPSPYPAATDLRPMSTIVGELRSRAENILTLNFPAVDVNIDGAKSISLEGGSLARKVDIVPATWFHTIAYQTSREAHHLGVRILDKNKSLLITNHPFLNRKLINDADFQVRGNLKRIVRLMKNLQADTVGVGSEQIKDLNSFDILSIAYDMRAKLHVASYNQLALVVILKERLSYLVLNKDHCRAMYTPDLSRKVFDDDEAKYTGLIFLYRECKELVDSLAAELNPFGMTDSRDVLLNKAIFG